MCGYNWVPTLSDRYARLGHVYLRKTESGRIKNRKSNQWIESMIWCPCWRFWHPFCFYMNTSISLLSRSNKDKKTGVARGNVRIGNPGDEIWISGTEGVRKVGT